MWMSLQNTFFDSFHHKQSLNESTRCLGEYLTSIFCISKSSFTYAWLKTKNLLTRLLFKANTACYRQCRPKKLTPWEILCFQPLWDMGGPYCGSGNFFYLALFKISELVANIGLKLKHLVPRDSFFIAMDLKNGAYSKTAK